jgi:O-acetyl-ADP-ribose deacetylase (regulator of RNase III)
MQTILTAIDDSLASAWTRFCSDLPGVRIHRGSILDLTCDAIISPANSFGFMDGGIDALYTRHFGADLQPRLHHLIRTRHHGELLVGQADIVETGNSAIPFLIAAPTMRVPMALRDSVNPYLAARAVFLLLKHGGLPINSVAFPGLGTGVGGIGPNTCAHQFRSAFEEVILGQWQDPQTWAEASDRHQSLYTDRPGRLQHP